MAGATGSETAAGIAMEVDTVMEFDIAEMGADTEVAGADIAMEAVDTPGTGSRGGSERSVVVGSTMRTRIERAVEEGTRTVEAARCTLNGGQEEWSKRWTRWPSLRSTMVGEVAVARSAVVEKMQMGDC